MGEVFSVEHRDDHIHVQLGPQLEVSSESRGQFWEMISRVCEERNSRRILIEGTLPATEQAPTEVVAAGQATAAVPNVWIAFHVDNFVRNEQSELFEAVAASKGVRIKFFDTHDAALNWLRINVPK